MEHVSEARIQYLAQFTPEALADMCQTAGRINEFTGETEYATLDEVAAVFAYVKESAENLEAEAVADETVGQPNPVASDTVSVAILTLTVDGEESEHGQYVTRWGIAYAVARELRARGIDPRTALELIQQLTSTDAENVTPVAHAGVTYWVSFA